jgi:mono/diheme cytochrome c family protein
MKGRTLVCLAAFALWLGLIGCEKGRSPGGASSGLGSVTQPTADAGTASRPTVRLVLLTDLAGAIAPCGCVKDQVGGLDHLGNWLLHDRARTPVPLVAAAGPLLFMDDKGEGDRADQDQRKAAAIADVLRALNFVAFAPGINDWVNGEDGLVKLAHRSGAAIIAGSIPAGPAPFASAIVKDAGGIKVGFVGFGQTLPTSAGSEAGAADPREVVAHGVDLAKQQGASVLIALAAVGRDEAKQIAQAIPELTAIVVGSPRASGEENTSAPQGEQVGGVIIVQAGNHLQSIVLLDLYVRDHVSPGHVIRFADATGLERSNEREDLAKRIDDLHDKISMWSRDPTFPKADMEARKRDLASLEEERLRLDVKPPPAQGSFFRYSLREVRQSMGTDPTIQTQMSTYYAMVNTTNQIALADRLPKRPAPGRATYVGVTACARCHKPALAMWKHTWHANAYGTLTAFSREFNLECVGCHVTGYNEPGGSTVTHVDKLQGVQCEVCHGPGSRHVAEPTDERAIIAKPNADRCLDCHHPPHVEQFDAVAKMKDILGPGHGMPLKK